MTSENFDVYLFAVDLVNYVFLKSSTLHLDAVVDNYPNFVCKSFTDILKKAVLMIKESVAQDVNEEFAKFQQQYKLRPDTYLKYGKQLRKDRFSLHSDVESFLLFSVHMAFLAHCFYSSGDRRAQVSAVFIISDDYRYGNMKFGMWEALNRVAHKIVCGTVAVDKGQPRQQLFPQLPSGVDAFSSPEIETTEKSNVCNEKAISESDGLMKTSKCNLLDCVDSRNAGEVPRSTRRRVNRRIREHAYKSGLKPMPLLEESLESSMEELSISKVLPIKLVNEDGPLNSTAELEFSWKIGKMNKNSPKRSSIDRQIFRLSPLSVRDPRKFSPKLNTSFS